MPPPALTIRLLIACSAAERLIAFASIHQPQSVAISGKPSPGDEAGHAQAVGEAPRERFDFGENVEDSLVVLDPVRRADGPHLDDLPPSLRLPQESGVQTTVSGWNWLQANQYAW